MDVKLKQCIGFCGHEPGKNNSPEVYGGAASWWNAEQPQKAVRTSVVITGDLTGVSSLIKPEMSISKPGFQNKADFTGVLWGFEQAHGLLCTQWRETLAVPV